MKGPQAPFPTREEVEETLSALTGSRLLSQNMRARVAGALELLKAVENSRAYCLDALFWLHDMVSGTWTPGPKCQACLKDDADNPKCTTLCAASRIEYAKTVLEDNPK